MKTAILDGNALIKLLEDANRDDRAEALGRLLEALRPVLLDLMGNKGWSSRRTARFLNVHNIKVRMADIERAVKEAPFGECDIAALDNLKNAMTATEGKEGAVK